MPRLAGMIHTIRRRRPLIGVGGSSLPDAVPTNVFVVMGAGSATGSPVGTEVSDVIVEGFLSPSTVDGGKTLRHSVFEMQALFGLWWGHGTTRGVREGRGEARRDPGARARGHRARGLPRSVGEGARGGGRTQPGGPAALLRQQGRTVHGDPAQTRRGRLAPLRRRRGGRPAGTHPGGIRRDRAPQRRGARPG